MDTGYISFFLLLLLRRTRLPRDPPRRRGRRAAAALALLLLFPLARRFPALGQTLVLLRVLALRVPLAGLQHQHADQHEGQDRVAGREDLEAVLAAEDLFAVFAFDGLLRRSAVDGGRGCGARGQLGTVLPAADEAEPFDDVGDVDGDAAHVQDEGRAVEEHVGLRGAVQLRDQAGQAEEDDDVEDARDQGRGGVEEAQVGFEQVVVRGRGGLGGPEEGVVVGEEGEDDAEEEAGCYS